MRFIKIFILLILFSQLQIYHIGCDRIKSILETTNDELDLFSLGDTITIRYNETVVNPQIGISISFDSLMEESRCPLQAICFWAGNAEVALTLETKSDKALINLNTNPMFPQDSTIFGYHIKLIDVIPYPETPVPIPPEDYSIEIVMDRDQQ